MSSPVENIPEEAKKQLFEITTKLASEFMRQFIIKSRCDELEKEILLCLTYDDIKELKNCVRETIKGFELEKSAGR